MQRHKPLVTVIASPASTSRVSVVVSETRAAVVTVSSGLVVGLAGCSLMAAQGTQSTILRVQVRVATESLLTLLALQRGKAGLGLRLTRGAVGCGTGTVSLGKRRAGPRSLRGIEALRLLRGHRRLLGDRLVLSEAALSATEDVRHASCEGIGSGGCRLLSLGWLGGSSAAVDRVTTGNGLVEGGRCRGRRRVVIREGVRLTIHSSLSVRAILAAVTILSAVRKVVVIISPGIIVHRAVPAVLVHLANVRSIVRVGVVRVSVSVAVSALARHVLSRRGLSSARKGGVRSGVATVGSFNMAIAARRLSGRNMRLHFGARNTKSCSLGSDRGILRLTVCAVVVVRKTLVDGIERRILATGRDGRLDRSLVGKWLLDLRLRLRDLLGEGVVGLMSVGVAGEISERVFSGRDLGHGRKSRGRARDCRGFSRNLSLRGRRQRGSRSNRGVLRGLSTGLSFFSVLINVNIGGISVQSHATKLDRSTIHSMVSWHDHSLLLFHHTTLSARGACALLEGTRGVSSRSSAGGSGSRCKMSSVKGTAHGASCGSRGSRRRDIGDLGKVVLRQIILRSGDISGRWSSYRSFFCGRLRLRNSWFGCFFGRDRNGDRNWDGNRSLGGSRGWGRSWCGFSWLLLRYRRSSRLLGGRGRGSGGSRSGSGSRSRSRSRSGRFLLRRRRRRFGKQASPTLLCALRDHTALGCLLSAVVNSFCSSWLGIDGLFGLDSRGRLRSSRSRSCGLLDRSGDSWLLRASSIGMSTGPTTTTSTTTVTTGATTTFKATTATTSNRGGDCLDRSALYLLGLRAAAVRSLLLYLAPLSDIACANRSSSVSKTQKH